jgi:hypothetical protein
MVAAIRASVYPDGDLGRADKREPSRLVKPRRRDVKPPSGDETLEAVKREFVGCYQCGGLRRPWLDPAAVRRDDHDRRGPVN